MNSFSISIVPRVCKQAPIMIQWTANDQVNTLTAGNQENGPMYFFSYSKK